MAIVQRNTYLPGQNLTSLAYNVDLNRLANDKTTIEVNFGSSPAEITVKVGSVIEVNGNNYTIEGADEVFAMANATHNYLIFDGATFTSSASIGTFDAAKQGYYQGVSNTYRTLKWFVDQIEETVDILTYLVENGLQNFITWQNQGLLLNHRISTFQVTNSVSQSTSSGSPVKLEFDTSILDYHSDFDLTNERFTCPFGGLYQFNFSTSVWNSNITHTNAVALKIYKNGGLHISFGEGSTYPHASFLRNTLLSAGCVMNLDAADTVEVYIDNDGAQAITLRNNAFSGILIR